MFKTSKLPTVFFLGLSVTLKATGADRVLSVAEADRLLHPAGGVPVWRPWRIDRSRAGALDLAAIATDVAQHVPLVSPRLDAPRTATPSHRLYHGR